MPCDETPLKLAAFKLAKTTTILSFIPSIGTKFTRPLTIVLGPDSSPKSIFSMYKLSASGCRCTSTIFPTLISNREGTTSSATGSVK